MIPFPKASVAHGQGHACGHDIESHLFADVDEGENLEGLGHAEHGSGCKNRLVVIRNLAIEVLVVGRVFFSHKTDVNATHRTSRTGPVSKKRFFSKALPGNASNVRFMCLLQVAARQGL